MSIAAPLSRDARIFVAGHRGMVGSAILRRLRSGGYENIVVRARSELDLTLPDAVAGFMRAERPDFVFLAAGEVGGIHANNTRRADFIYRNLLIEANVIGAAHDVGVDRLLFLGSSCIYPRDCPQPIREEYLLTGPLEPTNEPYAIAKIAGIKLCEAFNHQFGTHYFSVMPTNLYGPNDNYDLAAGHVLPALLRKAHYAKSANAKALTVWGSGTSKREFLHVDDMADACVFLMERGIGEGLLNVGTGTDLSIAELAAIVMDVVGFEGDIEFDSSKPDGSPRKLLSVERLNTLGWHYRIPLREGIESVYRDVCARGLGSTAFPRTV